MERGVVADLDGDGKTEVVAEINWFSGNSHFGRLVVFVDTGKGWRKVAQSEEPLGQIERITIKEGLIHVDSLRLGPNDARCCPSVKKTTRYRWQGAKVVEAGGQSAAPKGAAGVHVQPLPPLGLMAGHYASPGECRDSYHYFVYDNKRAGVLQDGGPNDFVPVVALKKRGRWWAEEEGIWAVRVESPKRITIAIQEEVPMSLCPPEQVPAWAKRAR